MLLSQHPSGNVNKNPSSSSSSSQMKSLMEEYHVCIILYCKGVPVIWYPDIFFSPGSGVPKGGPKGGHCPLLSFLATLLAPPLMNYCPLRKCPPSPNVLHVHNMLLISNHRPLLLLTGSYTTQTAPSLKAVFKKKIHRLNSFSNSHLFVWNCRNGPLMFISQQDVCEQFPVRPWGGKCSTFPKNSPCLPLYKTDVSNWPVKKKRKKRKCF